MAQVRSVADVHNTLGEGPVWDVREQALYWVDIKAQLLQRLIPQTGAVQRWQLPEQIGCAALRETGGAILALQSGFALFDFTDATLNWIAHPEPDRPDNRMNDGKCDRQGRFWAGTMDDAERQSSGALYRIDPDLSVHSMETGIGIPNALAWSPDSCTMYFADTAARTIYAYDHAPATGAIVNRRVFTSPPDQAGNPDGATVDAEGCLWCAQWDGWRVLRYTPDGTVERALDLPVQRPTSCAFGGPDLKTLFITTASVGLAPDALAEQPLAGNLLAVDLDVAGLPERRFAG
ncbi:SMP-30/gluconolactonase/LRE family protein [Rhodovibrio salinarum]|uniref:SMP-30/Gluconolactonase/LRE-like region domain-containing protein n=1 Tax=Rhodovibrio salinarum TaxID=1087 RepID=A0A934V0G4_9PROT|nr:SMP-30/gluconolactonase/LRE family protein [Rhodovibrio salinarum]MBK1697375.1 hypothetical protein [Rhodovibrio salinarum]